MMDCTDRYYRAFMRHLTLHTLLYTEMLTTGAVIHGDRDYLLGYDSIEQPLAIQLGGSEPTQLSKAAKIAQEWGYAEINLNVGCPSDRVQAGKFGACLMLEPNLVAECVAAMRASCAIPVTVKTRIGVDQHDSYAQLCHFIATVATAGCQTFIIHARKAWLQGLSPRQNREIPPLQYSVVYQLKRDFPELEIIINGGIKTLQDIQGHLQYVDGVMLGRVAYANPYLFAGVDQVFFANSRPVPDQVTVVQGYCEMISHYLACGVPMRRLVSPLISLFQGLPGARKWRRLLTEQVSARQDIRRLYEAIEVVSDYAATKKAG